MSDFLKGVRSPDRYDPRMTAQLIERLARLEAIVYTRGRDVEINLLPRSNAGGRVPQLILVSPNGTRYCVQVDNGGAVTTVAAT